jgi:hypothetical protein
MGVGSGAAVLCGKVGPDVGIDVTATGVGVGVGLAVGPDGVGVAIGVGVLTLEAITTAPESSPPQAANNIATPTASAASGRIWKENENP